MTFLSAGRKRCLEVAIVFIWAVKDSFTINFAPAQRKQNKSTKHPSSEEEGLKNTTLITDGAEHGSVCFFVWEQLKSGGILPNECLSSSRRSAL